MVRKKSRIKEKDKKKKKKKRRERSSFFKQTGKRSRVGKGSIEGWLDNRHPAGENTTLWSSKSHFTQEHTFTNKRVFSFISFLFLEQQRACVCVHGSQKRPNKRQKKHWSELEWSCWKRVKKFAQVQDVPRARG